MSITFAGNPVVLKNEPLKVGEILPSFTVVGEDLGEKQLTDFPGKKIILSVPSIDTDVCDLELRRFNQEIEKLDGFTTIAVSMDLPFAQARWCQAKSVNNLHIFSDFRHHNFGLNYGVYMEDIGLLARAVFVADEDNKLVHVEYVSEVTEEPDYDKALEAAKNL